MYKVNVWFHCTYYSNFSLIFSLWLIGIILKRVQHALTNHIREKRNIQQLIQRILSKYHLIWFHLIFLYNPLLIHLTLLHLIFRTKIVLQTKIFEVYLLKNLCTLFLKLKLISFIVIFKHTSSLLVKFLQYIKYQDLDSLKEKPNHTVMARLSHLTLMIL